MPTPTLTNFQGLQVIIPEPLSGSGGEAIQCDLKSLVKWGPKSMWNKTVPPSSATENRSNDYYPGSFWLIAPASPQLFLCTVSDDSSADWLQIFFDLEQETAPKLGGTLNGNGQYISAVAGLGIGVSADPTIGINIGGTAPGPSMGINVDCTLTATGTARAMYFTPTFDVDVSNPICINGIGKMTSGGTTATNGFTFRADSWTTNGVTITNLYGFYCAALTTGVNNFGFCGLVNAHVSEEGDNLNWNLYMSGTAANYLNGDIYLGDGVDINVGETGGTKIGTSASQLLGFWGVSPVGQFATTGTTTGFSAGSSSAVTIDSTFTGNDGSTAYTIGDLVLALKKCGIIAV